jgi:hypothetical protein
VKMLQFSSSLSTSIPSPMRATTSWLHVAMPSPVPSCFGVVEESACSDAGRYGNVAPRSTLCGTVRVVGGAWRPPFR